MRKQALGLGLRSSMLASRLIVASELVNSMNFQHKVQVDMLS